MGVSRAAGDGTLRTFDQTMDRAKSGDDDALSVLYLNHVAMVYGYLRACRAVDPEDVTSEVFLGMLRGLTRFEGSQADFRRWLMTIAHRRLVDERRRSMRNPHELIDPQLMQQRPSPNNITELKAIAVNEDLITAFSRLTDAQREVLALRFVADVSLQDVAAIVGRPVAAVKSLQSRGLAALRREMQPDGDSQFRPSAAEVTLQ
ncbi:MAG: RNA polymerase sigma factor [Acidimicrobiales bacterium]